MEWVLNKVFANGGIGVPQSDESDISGTVGLQHPMHSAQSVPSNILVPEEKPTVIRHDTESKQDCYMCRLASFNFTFRRSRK